MEQRQKVYEEVRCDYIDEDDKFWRVDAWLPGKEEGEVIAYVDDLTGRVLYNTPEARFDAAAQEEIRAKVNEIKNHASIVFPATSCVMKEPEPAGYFVTFAIDGRLSVEVSPNNMNVKDILDAAGNNYLDADWSKLDVVSGVPVTIEDPYGDIIWER